MKKFILGCCSCFIPPKEDAVVEKSKSVENYQQSSRRESKKDNLSLQVHYYSNSNDSLAEYERNTKEETKNSFSEDSSVSDIEEDSDSGSKEIKAEAYEATIFDSLATDFKRQDSSNTEPYKDLKHSTDYSAESAPLIHVELEEYDLEEDSGT